MITVGEIIQRVQSIYSKGIQSDDSRLSNRHIFSKAQGVRTTLLTRQFDKKQLINQWNYQVLQVKLIKASLHGIDCLPSMGLDVLRSSSKIPKPLTSLDSHIIQSVTTIDSGTRYPEKKWGTFNYLKGNKFTNNTPFFFIKDEYLYLVNAKNIELVFITAVFENILEVYNFQGLCCDDIDNCLSYLDLAFPLDLDLVDVAVTMIKEELVKDFLQIPEDKTNNSIDDRQA